MRVRFKPAALIIALAFARRGVRTGATPPIGRRPVFGYMASFAIVIAGRFLVPAICMVARVGRVALRAGWAGMTARPPTWPRDPAVSIS